MQRKQSRLTYWHCWLPFAEAAAAAAAAAAATAAAAAAALGTAGYHVINLVSEPLFEGAANCPRA